MFAKLLKHEFKSTAGMMGLLSLGALSLGLMGGLMLRYMVNAGESRAYYALDAIFSLLFGFVFLALLAYALGSQLYLAAQFYKRKFTDEGYLTFTLPVRCWQIFLSSFLNVLFWTVVIILVTLIAFVLIFVVGLLDTEVLQKIQEMNILGQTKEIFSDADLGTPVHSIIEFVSGIVIMLSSITIGSVLAKKHKILGAIGTYYAVSLLLSGISTWLMGMSLAPDTAIDTQRMYMISSAVNIVASGAGFFLSTWLMEKKLNLP